jgi:zinc protease
MRRVLFAAIAFSAIAAGPPSTPAATIPPASTIPPAPPVPVDPLGPMPDLAPVVEFSVPRPVTSTLPNGGSLWVIENRQLPLVTVSVSVPSGAAADPLGKSGLAAISNQMMTQGAGTRSASAFSQAVDEAGIDLSVDTDLSGSTITMSMRTAALPTALDLMSDMILRPKFAGKAFKAEQAVEVGALEQALNEPVTVAKQTAWKRWFGEGHPYSRPADGVPTELKSVKVKDAKAWQRSAWVPSGATWTVAGDVGAADVSAAIQQRFGAWTSAGATAPAAPAWPAIPAHASEKIVLVDRPGSAQTMFYVVYPGKKLAELSVTPLEAGTIVLGGTFTSRLNHLLREVRGYTYGVRASTVQLPEAGIQAVTTRIRTDVTGPAMTDLVGELKKIGEGVTDAEVGKARGAARQDVVEAMDGLAGVVGSFARAHRAGLGPDRVTLELVAMAAVDKAAIDGAMKQYDPANGVFVLVGDVSVIQKPLADAGFTNVEVVH